MADVHWIASYPKSGNTWLRILLANYLAGDHGAADINQLPLYGMTAAYLRGNVDRYLAFKSSCFSRDVMERARPDLTRALAAHAPPPLVLKVHDCWRLTDTGQPMIPADITAGVIYAVRNPLDVAVSAAGHWGVGLEDSVERMCLTERPAPVESAGITQELPQWTGSWSENVTSWLDRSGLRVLPVRYEDLVADTEARFAEMLAFMGWTVIPERVATAVERSRFERLHAIEAASGFRERVRSATTPFFRTGKAGGWRDALPAPLARRLIDAHGETMRRFGYLDEAGKPIG